MAVVYEPVARKEAGTAVGFVAASRPNIGGERFLAKLGLPDVRCVYLSLHPPLLRQSPH